MDEHNIEPLETHSCLNENQAESSELTGLSAEDAMAATVALDSLPASLDAMTMEAMEAVSGASEAPSIAAKLPQIHRRIQCRGATPKRRNKDNIFGLTIHTPEGYESGTLSVLSGTRAGFDWYLPLSGKLYRCNDYYRYYAWHSGHPWGNPFTLGIEQGDFAARSGRFGDAHYHRLARLCAYLAETLDLRIQRSRRAGTPGFISHADLTPASRTDPGAGFLWEKLLDLTLGYRRGSGGGGEPDPDTHDDHLFDTDYGIGEEKALRYCLAHGANQDRASRAVHAIYNVRSPETTWKPAVRTAQSFLETNGWNYGGDSRWANFAGIKKGGQVGDEPRDFEVPGTAEDGAHMHANHARAYSLRDAVSPVHDRYSDALAAQKGRGNPIVRISQLGGGIWATDPAYAEKILGIIKEMKNA